MGRSRAALVAGAALAALSVGTAEARAETAADAGALHAEITEDPWSLDLVDDRGRSVLAENDDTGTGPTGTLGFRTTGGVWRHATRVVSSDRQGGAYTAELATNDPLGRRLNLRLEPDADGVIALEATVTGPTLDLEAVGIGFEASDGERYLGFGERSNAVDQRGQTVENYVSDGPYQAEERPFLEAFVPPWGFRERDDATYFPVPWLLSTEGYGVLVDNPETSYFRLGTDAGDAWSVEVTDAPDDETGDEGSAPPKSLNLRFFAGPKPADALGRFTEATGHQPKPAAPWYFGPWIQPTADDELDQVNRLRKADAPLSVAQTYLHYLPCGEQEGKRPEIRDWTDAFHDKSVAVTTYFNPMLCTNYEPVYGEAVQRDALTETATGDPYQYRYSTNSQFLVAQFDFFAAAGRELFGELLNEAVDDGYDGWMEDFGEYTPLDSRSAGGRDGTEAHNRYATRYHCAAYDATRDGERPLARFQRSGWTGAARCAQIVWGGDPTTDFGFDGLESAVQQSLSIGLSGVSTWGSDIGGFFALGQRRLTPELLKRWVQFGAVSPVMRTQAEGIALPPKERPQVYDDEQLPNWRRYAKLHTQLYPYLVAADREYRRHGLPLMRHLSLEYPRDDKAAKREDEFLFGPDLLAAPVVEDGAREREVYLPKGRWVDLWRSATYDEASGGLELGRAELRDGERSSTLPAPLEELPLLARAGTVLPLLPRDVDTLTDYGEKGVSLDDRRDEMELLAYPRGDTEADFNAGEELTSREMDRRWKLRVDGDRRRTYSLQTSTKTLKDGFDVCEVELDGEPLRDRAWRYDDDEKALSAEFETRAGRLVAQACE